MDPGYPSQQPLEHSRIIGSRVSLHDVFQIYRLQFSRWFAVTAPTSVIAALVLLATDWKVREILAAIPRASLHLPWSEVVLAGVLRFMGFFVAWLLGCFALAAIATIVNGLDDKWGDAPWRSDSFQRAREHFPGILGVAFFTFWAFALGVLAMALIGVAFSRVTGQARFYHYGSFTGALAYILVAGVLCWYGMAIPLIISREMGIRAALKRSIKISNGYEGFLFLLVLESVAGSYVAWYAAHIGISLVTPSFLRNTAWYGWIVFFASILASAAVEPPMFIGFSLLARLGEDSGDLAPGSQQSPQID